MEQIIMVKHISHNDDVMDQYVPDYKELKYK